MHRRQTCNVICHHYHSERSITSRYRMPQSVMLPVFHLLVSHSIHGSQPEYTVERIIHFSVMCAFVTALSDGPRWRAWWIWLYETWLSPYFAVLPHRSYRPLIVALIRFRSLMTHRTLGLAKAHKDSSWAVHNYKPPNFSTSKVPSWCVANPNDRG